jgi:hypothetical protein
MVRRMALAKADGPVPARHPKLCALGQPGETQGHRIDDICKVERPFCSATVQLGPGHSGPGVEGQRFERGAVLHVQGQHPRVKPGGAGGQKFGAARLEPARKAHMVGMVVGQDHAGDGLACHGAGKQPLPDRLRALRGHAGVHDGPAVGVVQRVDVHMVQRHRQRQAQPEDAGRDRNHRALGRRVRERVADAAGHAARSSGVSA